MLDGIRRTAAAAAVLLAAAAALAQEAVRVDSISFEGNRRYSTENLKYSMRTKEGKGLDRDLLNQDLRMLRVYFEEISLSEEAVPPNGVRLVFRVSENPVVSRVEFTGVREFRVEDLQALVETRTGYPLASFKLENDAHQVERKYRDAGYHFVEVKAEVKEEEGARRVVFRVVEGPEVTVDDVLFEGNASIPAGRLRGVMALRPSKFLSPTEYVERRLEEDRIAVAKHYRDQGFLDARVWIRNVAFDDDRDEATISIAVEEGGPWSLGEVQVTGASTVPDRDRIVRQADRLVPGSRWLQKDIDRAVQGMEDEARRQGFSDVRVEVGPIPRAEGRVQDLRLTVREGRRFTIRFLNVAGNVLTQDKVILREFTVAPGDPLDSGALDKSVRRVLDTQYFSSVVKDVRATDDPDRKDVEIRVEENPRTSNLQVGFGVSSDTGLFGRLAVTFRNFDIADVPERISDFGDGRAFKGAGQTLQIALQPGTDVSTYELAFTEPWFMDRRVSVGFDLYAYESGIFVYDESRTGVKVMVERTWLLPGEDLDDLWSVGLTPRVESLRLSDVDEGAPPGAFAIEGQNGVHAATLDVSWLHYDQIHATERGWSAGWSAELAGSSLGGDFDYLKNKFDASRVFTLFRDSDERAHTLRVRTGIGFAMTLEDGVKVPLPERFLAGGGSGFGAVRGYDYAGLGPHGVGNPALHPASVRRSIEQSKGEPMGGDALAVGTIEYGFPLWSDVIRGAAFVDAGNLAFNTGDLGKDWRTSAGFGILVRIPFLGAVPLRFDFGWPLHRVSGDDTGVLSFNFTKYF